VGVGVGLFLFTRPAAENFMSTSVWVSEASERVAEATQRAGAVSGRSADREVVSAASTSVPPMPNLAERNMAPAATTPSDRT
jgi:hypothetical protein